MENAAERICFASYVYTKGVDKVKTEILEALPENFKNMHLDGDIHIHDLEAFNNVNNCCTPDLFRYLDEKEFDNSSDIAFMFELFEYIKELVTNIAKDQAGGIGFGNIDADVAKILGKYAVAFCPENIAALHSAVRLFIRWANEDRTRFCRENYYLTMNLGLATDPWGREVIKAFLTEFMNAKADYVKPNIVFKVNALVNSRKKTVNYDLFQLALQCTAKRMIPTYLLTDSDTNKNCRPEKLNIMGCRTRVYDNITGEEGSVGRGNIGYVTINLPRLALKSSNVEAFLDELQNKLDQCFDILVLRREALRKQQGEYQQFLLANKIWNNVASIEDMLDEGSYSIGFIGLTETVEVLTGSKIYESEKATELAYKIVAYMRNYIDGIREKQMLNFSLLATPGEMVSGKFCNKDREMYPHPIQDKGYYTNSFHVNVDAGITILDKLNIEGKFHKLCNGGSISYIEFQSACLENAEAIEDAIAFAEKNSVSYLGFNYPLDICNDCGYTGTYDSCPVCKSVNIKRIRRVSGYLEDASYFSSGKKHEIRYRKANPYGGRL